MYHSFIHYANIWWEPTLCQILLLVLQHSYVQRRQNPNYVLLIIQQLAGVGVLLFNFAFLFFLLPSTFFPFFSFFQHVCYFVLLSFLYSPVGILLWFCFPVCILVLFLIGWYHFWFPLLIGSLSLLSFLWTVVVLYVWVCVCLCSILFVIISLIF